MTGAWTMNEDYELVLDPEFQERLDDIKRKLRERWLETICDELSKATGYEKDVLLGEFLRRCEKESGDLPAEIVDRFIIEALEGSI